jgi:hypothetical protein
LSDEEDAGVGLAKVRVVLRECEEEEEEGPKSVPVSNEAKRA